MTWHWPPYYIYECRSCHYQFSCKPSKSVPSQCPHCGNRGQSLQHCRSCDKYTPGKYFDEVMKREGWKFWEEDACPACLGYDVPEEDMFVIHEFEEDPDDPGRCKVCTEQLDCGLHETWLLEDE